MDDDPIRGAGEGDIDDGSDEDDDDDELCGPNPSVFVDGIGDPFYMNGC